MHAFYRMNVFLLIQFGSLSENYVGIFFLLLQIMPMERNSKVNSGLDVRIDMNVIHSPIKMKYLGIKQFIPIYFSGSRLVKIQNNSA